MRPLERVLEHVEGVEERANGFWALCPAHEDRNPSLHVEEGEDGRVLLKCRAGCGQPEVMAALEERGLRPRDLFTDDGRNGSGSVIPLNGRSRGPRAAPKGRGRLVRTFEVKGPDGELVALHERYEAGPWDKSYVWRRRRGGPTGLEGLPLKDLPLYGSERAADWPEDAPVVLVEGEPAADALRRAGIRALGTVCGAQSVPSPEPLEVLRGRPVVLWPDTDEAGLKHMNRIAGLLGGVAAAVRRYEWTNAPEVRKPDGKLKAQDAADHPALKGGDRDAVRDLARELRAAPEWKPPEDPPAPDWASPEPRGFHLTDMGNAERFVARHGEDVRYCYPWSKWLVWTGARWERDDSGCVHRLAKETVRGIYAEATTANDEGTRKAIAQHATRSEAEAKIKAMLELAKSEVPVSPDDLDADPWLLNAPNGTVDLKAGGLRPHRRRDLLTKMAGAEYDQDAEAPAWAAFLERVLPGEELRGFVQRGAGYSATGDTSEQVMFINHGAGANGKSTFQEALAVALGEYAMRAPTEMLMMKRSGGIPNDVARLKGARFVAASETEEGKRLAESLVKDLTGQDTISARFMRAEWFDFKPTHKLWLSTNHKPEIRGTDNAIWRRIRLVPWSVVVPPAERDRKLPEKLRAEAAGILSWVVRGCLEWLRTGLGEPEEVRDATAEYRAEQDVLAGFLEECCVLRPEAWVKFAGLYEAYTAWCEKSNEFVQNRRRFGNQLKERGFEPDRGTGNVPIRPGLALRSDREPPDGGGHDHRPQGNSVQGNPGQNSYLTTPQQNGELLPKGSEDRAQGNSGSESYPTVTPQNTSKSELSEGVVTKRYPGNTISSLDFSSREANVKQSNYDNYGNSEASETVATSSPKIASFLADPPRWLVRQVEEVRRDPTKLKPTCSSIAYEVYGYSGRGAEIEDVVSAWIEDQREEGS